MTHLLPGGEVPWVHGARSPGPPWLPNFANPRSVCYLATVVAGAYPLRRPPDARSPGLPASPGPCYWLVASVTAMGWRGGSPAVGLVQSTVCYYCLGGCSALAVCVRRPRLPWGVGTGAGSCVSPWAPPCPHVPHGACCGLCRPDVPSLRPPVRHSMRSVRSAGPVRLPFGSAPHVRCVCVRSCSRGVRATHPPQIGMARALRVVPAQGAGRAVPGGSCPSAFPATVPCSAYLARGGVAWSLRLLVLLGVMRPPAGRPAFVRWLCTLWGQHEGARGERLSPGCRASGDRRSPTPDRPSFGACGRVPLATGCGYGECGRGNPSPTPLRALLRAGFARCWGSTRAPGGGASCLAVGCPGSGALPLSTALPLGRAAGTRYPLPVAAGGVGVGTRHQPHSARFCELALCAVGAARGRLVQAASCPGVVRGNSRFVIRIGVRDGRCQNGGHMTFSGHEPFFRNTSVYV